MVNRIDNFGYNNKLDGDRPCLCEEKGDIMKKGTLNFSLETVLYVIGAILFFGLLAYFVLSSTHTVSFDIFEKLKDFFTPLTE